MSFETYLLLLGGLVLLYMLARLVRAASTGRVRLGAETFSRDEAPRLYWREIALDLLLTGVLGATLFVAYDLGLRPWLPLALSASILGSALVRMTFPREPDRARAPLFPRVMVVALIVTALTVAAAALILIWLGS